MPIVQVCHKVEGHQTNTPAFSNYDHVGQQSSRAPTSCQHTDAKMASFTLILVHPFTGNSWHT